MLEFTELHRKLDLSLSGGHPQSSFTYRAALGAIALLVDDDEIEARSAWFDYGRIERLAGAEAEVGVHVRLLTRHGVVLVDCSFNAEEAPVAVLVPWSRVQRVHVATTLDEARDPDVVWLETADERIELRAKYAPEKLREAVASALRHVS